MFGSIAPRYDLANHLLSCGADFYWRKRAAEIVASWQPNNVVDLATGTGDLALELRELHPHREIVAADFAAGMLREAATKMREIGAGNRVRLVAADALALPFPDRTFACVTSAFLLRNLADLRQGFSEMRRVTRPGGRVVALEITQATLPGFRPLFRFYFHHVVPRIGGVIAGDREAYTYLPQSVDRFLTPPELSGLMGEVGLRAVKYQRLGLGTVTIHVGVA
jgi:demethylmenaquinone methyltransferase/2-methoxy-6-polyprenyl-1,4-benzoquinol methylase